MPPRKAKRSAPAAATPADGASSSASTAASSKKKPPAKKQKLKADSKEDTKETESTDASSSPSPAAAASLAAASSSAPVAAAAAAPAPVVVTAAWAAGFNVPPLIVQMVQRLRTAVSSPRGWVRTFHHMAEMPRSGEKFVTMHDMWIDDGETRYRYHSRVPTALFRPREEKDLARLPCGGYPPSEHNCYDLGDLVELLSRAPTAAGVNPFVDFLLGRRDDWPHVQPRISYGLGRNERGTEAMETKAAYLPAVRTLELFRKCDARDRVMNDGKNAFAFPPRLTHNGRWSYAPLDTLVPLRCGESEPPAWYNLKSLHFFRHGVGESYPRYKTAAAKQGLQIVPLGEVGGFVTCAGGTYDLDQVSDSILDLDAWARFQALTPEEQAKAQEATTPQLPAPKVKAAKEAAAEDGAAAAAAAAAAPVPKAPKVKAVSASAAAAAEAASGVVDLTGKRFVVMGEFDRGKFKVESQIAAAGGEVTKAVAKSVAYVVCGRSTDTKYGGVSGKGSKAYSEAKKLKITILDEAGFQELLDAQAKSQQAALKGIAADLIPDLANIVAGYAAGVDAHELGAVWLDVCHMRGCEPPANAGVSAQQIEALEAELQLSLPADLKSLLRVADGSGSGHPSGLFPSLRTLASHNRGGMAKSLRDDQWNPYKYLGLGSDEYLDLRGNTIMEIRGRCEAEDMRQTATSLRGRIEAYRSVVQLKLADVDDRVRHARELSGQSEHEYLRAHAAPAWLSAHPLPAPDAESAKERAAREADEVRQLRAAETVTSNADICGPHDEAVARYRRFVERRAAARAHELRERSGAAEASSASASSASASASAAPASASSGVATLADIHLGRPLEYAELPWPFRNKLVKVTRRFAGGYDS